MPFSTTFGFLALGGLASSASASASCLAASSPLSAFCNKSKMAARVTLFLRPKKLFAIIDRPPANIESFHARIIGTSMGCAYVPHTAARLAPLPPLTVINMSCSVTASSPLLVIASAKSVTVCLEFLSLLHCLNCLPLLPQHNAVTLTYPLGMYTKVVKTPYLQL